MKSDRTVAHQIVKQNRSVKKSIHLNYLRCSRKKALWLSMYPFWKLKVIRAGDPMMRLMEPGWPAETQPDIEQQAYQR
ncbi:hypothetical protein C1H46_003406 [Malus baccata]|uniref:Uncharacterized protein n=1 Tax=Malus baccata TaxID=106549 RepID=A0A540NIX6_MALBA|nr:hypothetical protein C1H46_003406 [Malus baccata]